MPDPAAGRTTSAGSATRLLVLGAVRIFQPVHGYFLRRELVSWDVGEWANIHPGSIYNALRVLVGRGLLEAVATTQARGSGPARTAYRLTPDGETEFADLLRTALRGTADPTSFLVAISFAFALTRAEVIEAVEAHAAALERQVTHAERVVAEVLTTAETPDSATEVMRILAARISGELTWARDYLDRVRHGAYAFLGEQPDWQPTQAQVAEAIATGAHLPHRTAPAP